MWISLKRDSICSELLLWEWERKDCCYCCYCCCLCCFPSFSSFPYCYTFYNGGPAASVSMYLTIVPSCETRSFPWKLNSLGGIQPLPSLQRLKLFKDTGNHYPFSYAFTPGSREYRCSVRPNCTVLYRSGLDQYPGSLDPKLRAVYSHRATTPGMCC